jgi:hypothetical protein
MKTAGRGWFPPDASARGTVSPVGRSAFATAFSAFILKILTLA